MSPRRPASPQTASCAEVDAKLFELVENELPAAEAEALARHVQACPACTAMVESYKATPVLARAALLEEVPADVMERLVAAISKNVTGKQQS